MDSKHRILVLETLTIIGESLKTTFEHEKFPVAGIVNNWAEFFHLLPETNPDIVLLDLTNYSDENLKFLRKLKEEYPQLPVLVISEEEYSGYFADFFILGVNGIIYGTASPSVLKEALHKISSGSDYFSDDIIRILKDSFRNLNHSGKILHKWGTPLTARETDVLTHFCNGLTYKEIGSKLKISPRTVESHKKNIHAKLKIRSTAEMIRYATHHHLI